MPFAPRSLLAILFLVFLAPATAGAAPGYILRAIALEGDPAPGTEDTYGEFFQAAINESGDVAFSAPLSSGPVAFGVWVDEGGGPVLRMRDGDPAPAPAADSYLAASLFSRTDTAGDVAVAIVLSGGTDGIFLDASGVDSALVLEGEAAPTPPGGTLDASLADISGFTMNPAGDIALRSGVTGGSNASGVFVRTAAGTVTMRAGAGDAPLGGGPDTFASFDLPSISPGGSVAFGAALAGGSATAGLFLDSGSGPALLVRDGDAAPDTGGGTFVDFLYPAVNADGEVAFLSNVAGGSATAGLFVATPAVSSVVVEGQVVPGAGPVATVANVPVIASDGTVALSLGFASGPVDGGVYLHAPGGGFSRVAVQGDRTAGTFLAELASFGQVGLNDAGQVAFVATLDDGRTGVFLATPTTPRVPALPGAGVPVLALLLAVVAARASDPRDPGRGPRPPGRARAA